MTPKKPCSSLYPKSKRLAGKAFVTVCVAALASNLKAIACVADKALSYGDHIQWDSDSSKILKLNPSGTVVMFSGAEEPNSKVLANFIARADDLHGKARQEIVKICEAAYREIVDELAEAKFLRPRLLTRKDYLSAITSSPLNAYIKAVAQEIDKFELNCNLLVCGFDIHQVPFILDVYHPGIATDMTLTGFHAIGSGWDKAVSRLLFSEHKREHSIERTLYDAFDAKANAEMSAGVGYAWDAVIVTGGAAGCIDVSEEIKDLIERVWVQHDRSPFETYKPKEDLAPPPKNWQKQLSKLITTEIISKIQKTGG